LPTTPPEDFHVTLVASADDADAAFRDSAPDEPVLPCQKKKLVIQLVGEDGLPVPGARYRIVLQDGTVVEGVLDGRGIAVQEEVEGDAKVSFPDIDAAAWEPVE
jgi:hypothetical protein